MVQPELETGCLMEPVDVAIPERRQVINFVRRRIVNDTQAEVARQLALCDAHFPKGLAVGLFVCPAEPYVAVFLTLHDVCRERMMVSPGLAPGEGDDAVVFADAVSYPSFQTVVCTDEVPHDIGLPCR